MKTFFTYLALITIAFLLTPQTTTAQCHFDDWVTLKVFYETTTNWQSSTGWAETFTNHNTPLEDCNLGDLSGIALNEDGRIRSIYVTGSSMNGSLPPEIGLLTELEYITISGSQLNGPIPPEIGNLKKLIWIRLRNNQISGTIPVEISTLPNLDRLELENNNLSGTIPPELGNLSNLTYLELDENQLTGTIPAELANMTNLTSLRHPQ